MRVFKASRTSSTRTWLSIDSISSTNNTIFRMCRRQRTLSPGISTSFVGCIFTNEFSVLHFRFWWWYRSRSWKIPIEARGCIEQNFFWSVIDRIKIPLRQLFHLCIVWPEILNANNGFTRSSKWSSATTVGLRPCLGQPLVIPQRLPPLPESHCRLIFLESVSTARPLLVNGIGTRR